MNSNPDPKPVQRVILRTVGISLLAYLILSVIYGEPKFGDLLAVIPGIFTRDPALIRPSVEPFFWDWALFGLAFFFWVGFFSQFVIPLNGLKARVLVYFRLWAYLFRAHGPALVIRNGVVRARKNEINRRGRGVILLDNASAAVLSTDNATIRVVGPGTVFTRQGEVLLGTVDLHRQVQIIGPEPGDDPFRTKKDEEFSGIDEQVNARRWLTSGMTRDTVEVVPRIIAVFQLDSTPDEGSTPFGFRPESVRRAVLHTGIDPSKPADVEQRIVPWNKLPAFLAADLWREYLRKFLFKELFSVIPDLGMTGLEAVTEQVRLRLTQAKVEEFDDFGRPTGRRITSLEFKVLSDRGIRVLALPISNLIVPPSVHQEIEERWRGGWIAKAQMDSRMIQQRQAYETLAGEQMAVAAFAEAASRPLGTYLSQPGRTAPGLRDAIEWLVRSTQEAFIQDPDIQTRLTGEKADLADILEWIRKQAP